MAPPVVMVIRAVAVSQYGVPSSLMARLKAAMPMMALRAKLMMVYREGRVWYLYLAQMRVQMRSNRLLRARPIPIPVSP